MENTQPVVNTAPDQRPNSEVVNTQTQLPVAPVVTTVPPATQPGDKTESALLLESLKEERAKRRELEDKLNNLNTTNLSDEVYSDEGKLLNDKISSLEAKLEQLEEDKIIVQVHSKFPVLKEHSVEFDEFRKDYPRHKMENVAKLFLTEKGLLESPRKGLENPTGGQRGPAEPQMTKEEVKNLRETNFKLYKEKLNKGLIRV